MLLKLGTCISPGARGSPLEFEYPVYENKNEVLGSAIRFSFRGARLGGMVVAMAAVRIMGDLRTGVIQAPSLWKWAIGLTTCTVLATM